MATSSTSTHLLSLGYAAYLVVVMDRILSWRKLPQLSSSVELYQFTPAESLAHSVIIAASYLRVLMGRDFLCLLTSHRTMIDEQHPTNSRKLHTVEVLPFYYHLLPIHNY